MFDDLGPLFHDLLIKFLATVVFENAQKSAHLPVKHLLYIRYVHSEAYYSARTTGESFMVFVNEPGTKGTVSSVSIMYEIAIDFINWGSRTSRNLASRHFVVVDFAIFLANDFLEFILPTQQFAYHYNERYHHLRAKL